MLVRLTKAWRKRAAAFGVVLYALCLIAPVAAFAFSDNGTPAHCLTMGEIPQAKSEGHSHHDGMDHASMTHEAMTHATTDHGTPSSGGSNHATPAKCCGLFCATAIAPPVFGVADMRPIETTLVTLPPAESLLGRSASRIDRPPRVLPSL